MDASDLFDVIHVFYEEDITPLWEQHIDVKDRVREAIYPMLYDRPYKFSSTKAKNANGMDAEYGTMNFEDDLPASTPQGSNKQVKPYMPVSTTEDLMKVLDVPMGRDE